MRQVIIIMLLCVIPALMQAQMRSIDDFYEKYKHLDGFTTLHFSGNILSKMLNCDENRHARDQVNNLTDLKIISTEEEKGMINPADIRKIKREITDSDYEELMVINDYPSTVRLMALEKRDVIRELVLFVDEPGKFTLISFKGKINLRDMGEAGHNIQVNGKNYWKELASK